MPVMDDDGNVVFICAEGRDITEKKAQEREIAQKNIELQGLLERIRELDEIKTQFFANVSHELRTPLALILGPAQRLIDDDGTMEPRRSGASRRRSIARNARMLLKHVNDLLDMSRLEARKLKIELQDTDVAALVRFLASHFAVLAADRDIEYVVDADEACVAAVDPDKLQRVLMNLLGNAFKFVPAGGRVRCALRAVGARAHGLRSTTPGPGVKPELRQAIFERFRQGDGGINRKAGGTGLGLAIAKEFVEMHKGRIEVLDSDLGGARFQVTMPLQRLGRRRAGGARDAASTARCSTAHRGAALAAAEHRPMPRARPSASRRRAQAARARRRGQPRHEPLRRRSAWRATTTWSPRSTARRAREGAAVPPDADRLRHHDAERERRRDDRRDAQAPGAAADADPAALGEGRRGADGQAPRRRRAGLHRQAVLRSGAGRSASATLIRAAAGARAGERAPRAAESANRAKDEFLAMLGHELRNPLSPILTALQLMKLRGDDGSERERTVIERQVNHLTRLVDDLLDVSRIARGKVELKTEIVEMADVVAKAIEMASPLLEQRTHTLTVDVPRRGLRVDGDPTRLSQVDLEPPDQRREVHAAGRTRSPSARERSTTRWCCRCATPASASRRRCCRASSICSCRSDRRSIARRAGSGSA